jgi:hypothetical protein
MNDAFVKRGIYGYILCSFSIGSAIIIVWLALYTLIVQQQPVQPSNWVEVSLIALIMLSLCLALCIGVFKQLRTTFGEDGVRQVGLFGARVLAWRDVKELSDLAFSRVVLKTDQQQIAIDLMFYRSPYHTLATLRARVPPSALRTEWRQVDAARREERRRRVIGLWVSFGIMALVALFSFVVGTRLLALLPILAFNALFDLYAWYQRREMKAFDGT